MELLETLEWRYATKRYNKRRLSEEKLDRILKAINLSASSMGMQPYRIFVIENKDLRKDLSHASFNKQIIEASHLLVFAVFTSVDEKSIDEYIELIANQRNIPIGDLEVFKQNGLMQLLNKTDSEFLNWSKNQAYIALGTGLIAAAAEKVDATPMEGFDSDKFDEILGFKDEGLKSVVLLALGYRDEKNDPFVHFKKVRWPKEEFMTTL